MIIKGRPAMRLLQVIRRAQRVRRKIRAVAERAPARRAEMRLPAMLNRAAGGTGARFQRPLQSASLISLFRLVAADALHKIARVNNVGSTQLLDARIRLSGDALCSRLCAKPEN